MNESLRILLVLEAAGGGAGRHVIDLANSLRDNGHDVHLVYSPTRIEATFRQDLASLHGITVHKIPMRRSPHPADLNALWALRRYIRKHGGFHIVHGHSSKAGALVRLLRLIGIRSKTVGGIVYTPHGMRTIDAQLSSMSRRIWGSIERVLNVFGGNLTIAVSTHERDHIIQNKISGPSRVTMVMNGLAEFPADNRDTMRREFGLSSNDFCVGFVGRFSSVKGPLVFVDAVAHAVKSSPNLRAVMLGYGELRDEVLQRIEKHKLNDVIQIHENRRATDCVSAFDVLAVSSFQEGLPYAVLEAMAAGKPVVATKVGGLGQLVEHGTTGYLVPIGDAEGLGHHLGRLATDEQEFRRLCANAESQRERFSAEQMREQTVSAYRRELAFRTNKGCFERSARSSPTPVTRSGTVALETTQPTE